jgi:deaminated glutathione amidase
MQACVAGIQMNSSQDLQENLAMAKNLIHQAVDQGARLIVLPEKFALMGMDLAEKVKHSESEGNGPIQHFMQEIAAQQNIWLVGGTIPIVDGQSERACAACLVYDNHGLQVARYDKVHLFDAKLCAGQERYAESNTTAPGKDVVVLSTPIGRLGLAVCYDIRFPELFRQMHTKAVEVIAIPTAFTYTTGKVHWDILIKARAIENMAYVVSACQTGTHPNGRRTYGHSMIVNPWGDVSAMLKEEVGTVVADIDLNYLYQLRQDFPVLDHRKL